MISNFKGKHHTEKTKEKMKIIKLERPVKYWLGKKRNNPEYIEKIRKAHFGQKCSLKQKEVASKNWLGKNNPRWSGGRYENRIGYVMVHDSKNRYRVEHRVIAEKIIGRDLKREETIHHINERKNDNRTENLYYFLKDNLHKAYHGLKNKPILKSNLIDYKVEII
jgi:hypothetical protein